MLIIMTSFAVEARGGQLTYATWSDYFNIVLLCILILGLLESLFVHSLVLSNKTALAHMVDSRARRRSRSASSPSRSWA